jgi:predicted outer membrane protein
MIRRIPWLLRVSVLVAAVLAISVTVFQSWSSGTPGTNGWTQTKWGPLGPADRDLLVKVRLAGLWEAPTGQQAAQQASTQSVRDLGAFLAKEHAALDVEDRSVADQLGVLLPTQANAQQQGWMQEISAATGADYDRIFVQRLRQAHGIVLPIISEVRVSTRNDLIRQFADTANDFVHRHMEHLEATGLVDYGQLPDPPSPGLLSGDYTAGDLIVPILVFIAALLAAVGLIVSLRKRGKAKPSRAVAPMVTPAAGTPSRAIAAIPPPRETEMSGPHRIPAVLGVGAAVEEATTGSHRFPPVTPPGESSGSRRAVRPSRYDTTRYENTGGYEIPVDRTGPRHSVRR